MKKLILALLIFLLASVTANATTITGSSGSLSASATFSECNGGNSLCITLTNTASADVLVPADVLTGVFWNFNGLPLVTLTPEYVVLASGSSVFFGGVDPGNMVGGEFAYETGSFYGGLYTYGVASSGYICGTCRFSSGSNLQGPDSVDGLQYGLTSAGDNTPTGNSPVTGDNALIQNSVLISLGVPYGTDVDNLLLDIRAHFQYGTSFSEPGFSGDNPVPDTATFLLMSTGLAIIGGVSRWKRKSLFGSPRS